MTYSDLITAASPSHWWRLDEESGTSLASVTGGWIATLSGSGYTLGVSSLLSGEVNKAISWGADSYQYALADADSAHLLGTVDFALSMVVKYTSASFATLLAIRNGATTPILGLITCSRITAGDISAETWAWSDASTRVRHPGVNDGNPHHVVVNYKHATTMLELWVDGVLRDSRVQGAGRPTYGSVDIFIGNNGNLIQGFSGGSQDEIALFGRCLTQVEIEELSDVALNGVQEQPTQIVISEEIDDVISSGWTSIAGKFSTQDELDYVIAYGYTPNVGKISAVEDIDNINILSIDIESAINCAVNIDEYIDKTKLSAANYSHRIYVNEIEDDIVCTASTWNVGIVKTREYIDIVSSQMVRGEEIGTASIIEDSDSVYAAAITSNVGKVAITCGLDDIGAVATNEQINVGVVNLAEHVDDVLSNAIICIGATVSVAGTVDEIKSAISSGSHGTVLIHEEQDVVKSSTKIIMPSLGFSRTLIGQLGSIQAQPIGALRFDRGSIEYENASTPIPINPIHFTR